MNKIYSCDIIKDLLPGYIDGVLSEAGTTAVKEHLETCEKCNQAHLEMKEGLSTEILPNEQLVLDGFKKVRQYTQKLKLMVGIVAGLLILLFVSIFLKIYVIGSPLSTHKITADNISYDEDTGNLVIDGTINIHGCRISHVAWKQSEEDDNDVNILVYGAETLPFVPEKKEFTVTIPNMKGKTAYFACPDYDQMEVYNWKHSHYEKLEELKEEIYNSFPALDPTRDALSYFGGVESVNGAEGIHFSVDSVIGENAAFWQVGDQLVTDGDFLSRDFDIWISLDKPYQIYVYDYHTGAYTQEFSIPDRYPE